MSLCTSGELLRFAVASVSRNEWLVIFAIRDFLRELVCGFSLLDLHHRELAQKLETMAASVLKVERGACHIWAC